MNPIKVTTILVIGTLLTSCSEREVSCEAMVKNVADTLRSSDDMKKASKDERELLSAFIPAIEAKLGQQCQSKELPADERQCLAKAKSDAQLKMCQTFK